MVMVEGVVVVVVAKHANKFGKKHSKEVYFSDHMQILRYIRHPVIA